MKQADPRFVSKRRKPAADRRERQLRIRVTEQQKREWTDAARKVGLDLSSWLRMLASRESQQVTRNEKG
jgi:hypothetical protein